MEYNFACKITDLIIQIFPAILFLYLRISQFSFSVHVLNVVIHEPPSNTHAHLTCNNILYKIRNGVTTLRRVIPKIVLGTLTECLCMFRHVIV
jgi:hypothetical protein